MRTIVFLVTFVTLVTGGCGAGGTTGISRPCGLLTGEEVTQAAGVPVEAHDLSARIDDGSECRWRRPASREEQFELRLRIYDEAIACTADPSTTPAPELAPGAFVEHGSYVTITVRHGPNCLRLHADTLAPAGPGTGISAQEARDLARRVLDRLH